MNIFKCSIIAAVFGYSCVQCSTIYAQTPDMLENLRIVVGVSLGYSDMSFPEKLDHNIGFPSTNLSLAAALNRWQLSVNGGFTLEDADISEEEDLGEASRDDIDVTLGYQISNNWSVFGGYKSGKTKMKFQSRDNVDEGITDVLRESYSQKGPFAGISYSWEFDKAGRLSVSLAYADLNAVNDFSANTDEPEGDMEALEFDDLTGRVRGDMTGFSYALAWTMPLSGNLLFQTRLKVNDYNQDITFGGQAFNSVDETFSTLHIGLAYVF